MFLIPFISAENYRELPQNDLTIQNFLVEMKANPENYILVINRSQEEIDFIRANSNLNQFLDYFDIGLTNSFSHQKNFILLEFPSSELGKQYALNREKSYIEVYENVLLPSDANMSYYIEHNFSTFDYMIIFSTIQQWYYNLSNISEYEMQFDILDSNHDQQISEVELMFFYLDNLIDFTLDYESSPINTDYLIIDKNEPTLLSFGQRDYCTGFVNTSIFKKSNYTYYEWTSRQSNYMEDNCFSSTKLLKLACSFDKVVYQEVECDYMCLDGKCVAQQEMRASRESIFTFFFKWIVKSISLDEFVRVLLDWIVS